IVKTPLGVPRHDLGDGRPQPPPRAIAGDGVPDLSAGRETDPKTHSVAGTCAIAFGLRLVPILLRLRRLEDQTGGCPFAPRCSNPEEVRAAFQPSDRGHGPLRRRGACDLWHAAGPRPSCRRRLPCAPESHDDACGRARWVETCASRWAPLIRSFRIA